MNYDQNDKIEEDYTDEDDEGDSKSSRVKLKQQSQKPSEVSLKQSI